MVSWNRPQWPTRDRRTVVLGPHALGVLADVGKEAGGTLILASAHQRATCHCWCPDGHFHCKGSGEKQGSLPESVEIPGNLDLPTTLEACGSPDWDYTVLSSEG